jgi:hypothetical protein
MSASTPNAPEPTAPASPNALRVVHVLTMNGRAAFDALSPVDRAQLEHVFTHAFGHASLEAGYEAHKTEGSSLYKLRLVRGDAVEWDVWIDCAMDNGAVFAPGTRTANGLGISGECVSDMTGRRGELVAETQRALDGYRGSQEQWSHDPDWIS